MEATPAARLAVARETLTLAQFGRLSAWIEREYGIRLPGEKKSMLESRLRRRLAETGCTTFGEYLDLVFATPGRPDELVHMMDVVTTNRTGFFREPAHFQVLVEN